MAVPTLSELAAVAERGVGFLEHEGQVTVLWERRLSPAEDDVTVSVVVTCVRDARCAKVEAEGIDDDALRRAAKAAALRAAQPRAWPSAGLPDPSPGRPHDGFDPELLTIPAADLAARIGSPSLRASAARIAIASTRGVRAAEERSHVEVDGLAAVTPAGLRPEPAIEVPATSPVSVAPGYHAVVLGPRAVAAVLDRLRSAFGVDLALGTGPLAGRLGTKVAAPNINLSDSARYPGTLPRSYDAEGVPRQPVPLIQDGIAHRAVHDTASTVRAGAETTGHATQAATLAPMPDHLVLVGGGAEDVHALARPLDRGLYLPTLGGEAVVIEDGELVAPSIPLDLEVDPLGVLAATEALTSAQRVVALRGHCPGGSGAAVVPALRATGGVRVRA